MSLLLRIAFFGSCLWILLGQPGLAQEETPSAQDTAEGKDLTLGDEFALLEEEEAYVELASRHKQAIGMSPSAITVITREDIEESGATTIPDLLRRVPGMDVVTASRSNQTVSARVRWTWENNLFLTLLDGREVNLDIRGESPWELLPVVLEDIERIEIIRGPGSALYGANAFVGVISITTKAATKSISARIHTSLGETGVAGADALVTSQIGNWGVLLGGGGSRVGTFMDPRTQGNIGWKVRARAMYQWTPSDKLSFESSLSHSAGPYSTGMGMGEVGLLSGSIYAAYQSTNIRSSASWTATNYNADNLVIPLTFQGLRLAEVAGQAGKLHSIDGQLQWTPPQLFESLLLIVGSGLHANEIKSGVLLDRETYADPTSDRYHQKGIDFWEIRPAAYFQGEYSPLEWLQATAGLRLDYSTQSGIFLSPRIAVVTRPWEKHSFRVSWARAFRKPSAFEAVFHAAVEFPNDSPIKGKNQELFQEFMATRTLGNDQLRSEAVDSYEMGYWGSWLEERLNLTVDLYYSRFRNNIEINPQIQYDSFGLPDLKTSSTFYQNTSIVEEILGIETAFIWHLSKAWSLSMWWSHRQVLGPKNNHSPKNLMALGTQFHGESGLVGSFFAFSRSEFVDEGVDNPQGFLMPLLTQSMPNVLLILSKLGYRINLSQGFALEAGMKLFLPLSPFSAPHFRFREHGGMVASDGKLWGGDELRRMLTAYVEGAF